MLVHLTVAALARAANRAARIDLITMLGLGVERVLNGNV